MIELRGRRVLLRRVAPDDVPSLLAILGEPAVAERWGSFTRAEVEATFVDDEEHLAISLDGRVIGAIQFHEEADEMYRHAGIDIFVATDQQGQGFGTDAIRTLARYLIEERGHHRLSIDPAADNARAIRAYERVGFLPVGVLRRYERGPDGFWHDGLLMDLLADELTDSGSDLPAQPDPA
jgi:aminoglycoside 6'-N-acetyltransferase